MMDMSVADSVASTPCRSTEPAPAVSCDEASAVRQVRGAFSTGTAHFAPVMPSVCQERPSP